MTEVARCQQCGQPLPVLSRTEVGQRLFRLLHPQAEMNKDSRPGGGFDLDGKSVMIRTSKLNEQTDRKTYRWSFSKGKSSESELWFWIGFDAQSEQIARAWLVPAEKWATKVTHVSQYSTSQWAQFQCFPSEAHPKPLRAHEIKERTTMSNPAQQQQQGPLTIRNFQRGQFRRYACVTKFNVGSIKDLDIQQNEYIHFDGWTLRLNGDSQDQGAWQNYHEVASKSIIGAINRGWLVQVPEGEYYDVTKWGSYQPPSANIQMRPADQLKAQRQGKEWANGGVVHQEDQQVGSVSGFVNQVNQHNVQAWNRRFGQHGGVPVQVQQHQMQPQPSGGQLITSSTVGQGMGHQPHQPQQQFQGQPQMQPQQFYGQSQQFQGQPQPPQFQQPLGQPHRGPGFQQPQQFQPQQPQHQQFQPQPQPNGPVFIAQQPAPVGNHGAMNPMLVGSSGGGVEVQDARPVNVQIRVPAKQTANIATGKINDDGVFDHRGQVMARPGRVTAFSDMGSQGTQGMGMVRDKHGNVLGRSADYQQVGTFNPGYQQHTQQGWQGGPQPWQGQQQFQGGSPPWQSGPQHGLQQFNQQFQPQQFQQQGARQVASAHGQGQPMMTAEGIQFATQGIGHTAQQATGSFPQAGPQFGSGQVVGRVGHTRGQQGHPQQQLQRQWSQDQIYAFGQGELQAAQHAQQVQGGGGQLVNAQGQVMTPGAQQAPTETPVLRDQSGNPIIMNTAQGPRMLMNDQNGQTIYIVPMQINTPNGPMLVPPGQTVSEEQLVASLTDADGTEIDPSQIQLEEQSEVSPEAQQLADEAAPAQLAVVPEEEDQGPPPVHPEAIKILEDRDPIEGLETRVICGQQFWPLFPTNWPFKSKPELRMQLAELHEEHAACLKAIFMAESPTFQAKMLERWPDLLTR